MKILFAFGAFLIGAAMGIAPSGGGDPGDTGIVEIQSCEDFAGKFMEFAGTMTFLKDIACDTPKIIEVKTELAVGSPGMLETKGLHFIVRKGGLLTFTGGGAINIARNEGSIWPLFVLSGEVAFEAGGWTPSYADGVPEDQGRIVTIKEDGGTINSQYATIHYTLNSVVVATAANYNQDMDGNGGREIAKQDGEHQIRLAASHEGAGAATNYGNDNDGTATALLARDEIDDMSPWTSAVAENKGDVAVHSSYSVDDPSFRGGCGSYCENTAAVSPVDSVGVERPPIRARESKGGCPVFWPVPGGYIIFSMPPVGPSDGPSANVPPFSSVNSERVLGLRDLKENAQGGGKDDEEAANDRLVPWLPYLKRVKPDLDRESTHSGEVEMSDDQRGGVGVPVDDDPVKSKAGPRARKWFNNFPWRRRKREATDGGKEVRPDEKRLSDAPPAFLVD